MLGKIVAGLSLVLILLVFAIVGMTAQVIEMSKETATSADGITTVAGSNQPAATGQIEVQDSLSDAYGWTPDQLNGVKSLYFPEKNEEACPSSTYCPDGSELVSVATPSSCSTRERHLSAMRCGCGCCIYASCADDSAASPSGLHGHWLGSQRRGGPDLLHCTRRHGQRAGVGRRER